jgi:hypothetical protein
MGRLQKHPSKGAYQRGCRCKECTKINSKMGADSRAKRKLREGNITKKRNSNKAIVGDTKKCPKCVNLVVVTAGMAKSRCYYCKDCWSAISRKYVSNNREKVREWNRKSLKNNKEATKRSNLKYKLNNPQKKKAHQLVQTALRNGSLVKEPCEVCGELKVHGHHDDYLKPLMVRWLCHKHHMELHYALLKTLEATQEEPKNS